MSAMARSGYFFRSRAQWDACLMNGARRVRAGEDLTLRPFAGYAALDAPTFPSTHARAPAIDPVNELVWCAGARLHRVQDGDETSQPAPAMVAAAKRCVVTSEGLWVVGPRGLRVECLDPQTLVVRFGVDVPGGRAIDIAGAGRDGILVLAEKAARVFVHRVDCAGMVVESVPLGAIDAPIAFAYVGAADRVFVIAEQGQRLFGFALAGDRREHGAARRERESACGAFTPCFTATVIASDGVDRLFVAGTVKAPADEPRLVVLDADGVAFAELALAENASGIAARRGVLAVTGERGVYRFAAGDRVPAAGPAASMALATPMLDAPDTAEARGWLRIEAGARLPAGTTLEIAFFATDDADEQEEMRKLSQDASIPPARRVQMIRAAAAAQRPPIVFHGSDEASAPSVFAAPLFDVVGQQLWVSLALDASPDAALPTLSCLAVLYPGRTLMESLPAVYRRDDTQRSDFLARFVGVLQAGSDDLDRRIASLAANLDPARAPDAWMNFVARWLGIPWDDAMDAAQKRCVLAHAALLARGRGTRAGLETLLACLVPGAPPRFRVADTTADHGIARIGGGGCEGGRLPAILCGLPDSAPLLGIQAKLDALRLPCGGAYDDDPTSRFLGAVRIDIAASADEKKRWMPWLARVAGAMLPAGVRPAVGWLAINALRGDRLGDAFALEEAPYGHLGTDAVIGDSRLAEGASTLPDSRAGGPRLH